MGYEPKGTSPETLKLWDVMTGRELHALEQPARVEGLAFSPDGRFLAASSDEAVQLWGIKP